MKQPPLDSHPRRIGAYWAFIAVASLLVLGCGGGGDAGIELQSATDLDIDDEDVMGPIDLGWGPGITQAPAIGRAQRLDARVASGSSATLVIGGPEAHVRGVFGEVFHWPIIPIHMVLLPDGRVMSYGSDQLGKQGASLHYTVWDPSVGVESESMQNLTHATGTNLFYNTQLVLPDSGSVLLLGGIRKDSAGEGFDTNDVDLFTPATNQLVAQSQPMAFARWYGTAVTTANGEQVLLGGRRVRGKTATSWRLGAVPAYSSTPEVYRAGQGWRTLTGAKNELAYGDAENSFWYPRAWQAPNGSIFVLSSLSGKMFSLDPAGTGSVTPYGTAVPGKSLKMPSVMFGPGKILSLRSTTQAFVIDINGAAPTVSATQRPGVERHDQTATVLADGKVWVNGGSVTHLSLGNAHYQSEMWDPATGAWTVTAAAAKPRLYHSASILLADGSVLTGGGGAPGPVTNLNAEIYFPPYLFKQDGSGEFAARPVIASSPDRELGWGEVVPIGIEGGMSIGRVTLVRTGSVTHGFNNEQRFLTLEFAPSATGVDVTLPIDRNLAPPGYYLLFVFDANGVPSKARMLKLNGA